MIARRRKSEEVFSMDRKEKTIGISAFQNLRKPRVCGVWFLTQRGSRLGRPDNSIFDLGVWNWFHGLKSYKFS